MVRISLTVIVIILIGLPQFTQSASAETRSCGELYYEDSDTCNCTYSTDQLINAQSGVKCCGVTDGYQCFTKEEMEEETEQDPDEIADTGTVSCGQKFVEGDNVNCDCASEVFFNTINGEDVYCCGWVVDGECATEYAYSVCRQIANDDLRSKCEACAGDEVAGVWTAVGCIPTDHTSIIQVFIKLGLVTGGGVALLIILAGSFMLSVSQGDPKKTSEAKEMITSAIIGLIFIIFSVSILQLIGVQILQIPGFAD